MENSNTMATEPPPPPPPSPSPAPDQLTELIQALDQAAQMARQLAAANPDLHCLILSSLHCAHLSLSSFLSSHHYSADNSVSSTGADAYAYETMRDEDDNAEEEQDSSMERMEEKMRNSLHIQSKRTKRPLSPSSAAIAEQQWLEERESATIPPDYDPHGCRLRNLDLVYQFHG